MSCSEDKLSPKERSPHLLGRTVICPPMRLLKDQRDQVLALRHLVRIGTDCWHVLKSPLNFTELFSPCLAPYRVICLLWFHSDLSNSPILKKKSHSCIAECGRKCLDQTSFDPILSYPSTPLRKVLVSGKVHSTSSCCCFL